MNRRRTPSANAPGAPLRRAPLPSLESRLDELQQQLDDLAREAREMRRLIDERKARAAEPPASRADREA